MSTPSLLFDLEEDDMAGQAPSQGPIPDLRPMEELLQAPTDGVGIQSLYPPFTKITQTVKLNNIPSDVVKLFLFSFSLEGAAGTWLEKEPPNSITTWNDLVSKFVNRFFPPSKTTNLRNEIMRLQQRFGETFAETWDRFKDLLNNVPIMAFLLSIRLILSTIALHEKPQGALPSNTEPNPREKVNSIMTRSGLTTGLKDLLKDKEKLEELANTPINVECSAILLNKVPEKLEDPGKLLIPCILQNLEVYNSLANSGASINLMPRSIYEKLGIGPLKPTRMTLELANRSVTFLMGIAEDVIIKVEKFNFLADFVIVDFEADPRVPIILRRPFLRTARTLVDLDKLISGSTTFPSDSSPSSPLVETSDSLLEEFADELALLDPFPLGNEDDNFDPEANLKEIEYLLNRDPSTISSPTNDIDVINPILERFIDEPALFYSSPPGDDDDDLFDLKSDNDEWKKILYGDSYKNTHSKNDKTNVSKTKSLIDEANFVESNVLPLQLLTSDSTLPEESSELSEIATLLSSPFRNEDKVFNPGILILDGTQIFNDESNDKDFKMNILSETLFEDSNFLPLSFDRELLFFLELTVIETLLSFSSKNEVKVFNPGILTSKGVHSFTLGLSHQTYETFKIVNVHPNILNEGPMKIFPFFCFYPKDKGIRGESS
ncbi:reverse transcriptase domain-containing protein [Tanacetum coccineum]